VNKIIDSSFLIALPVFISLGVIVGCNDGMASVGYVSGPSFIPFEGVINAFFEYGIPESIRGAFVGFLIWLGVAILLISLNRKQPKLPSIIQTTPPLNAEESMKVIETAIRKATKKSTGKLTEADFEKMTVMDLQGKGLTSVKFLEKLTQLTDLNLLENQLTSVNGLEKLTQLEWLNLEDNPDLTKTQVDKLKKALPNCDIYSDFE
tara:strand:+ start:81 stop:698 length:618 start_codon:yes stop_codon:yes gene_type:complete